jgi:hypothetical protein
MKLLDLMTGGTSSRKGTWMLMFVLFFRLSQAQTISQGEYFFDSDPGPGNGTPLVIASPADPVTFTQTISTSGLLPGYHILFVRTRTSTGIWSLYEPQEFKIDGGITSAEYFFDSDPGVGNGTAISPASNLGTITETISTSTLPPGEHFLFIRTRHDQEWSLSEPQEFVIDGGIIAAEYFFDVDPGIGNGTPLTPVLNSSTLTQTISTSLLPDGEHFLFVRTRHGIGNDHWSLSEPQAIYIRTRIVAAEYFFDSDPGLGNGTPLSIATPSDLVSLNTSIPVGALADGSHYLFVRSMDILGNWSLYEPQQFQVDSTLPIELINLKATVTNENQVRLTWTTLTEVNNDFFTVLHSIDGEAFSDLARLKGAGNSTDPISYEVIDRSPDPGANYYRLSQTDLDGHRTFSKVVVAEILNLGGVSLYPNPAIDNWYIDLADSQKNDVKLIEVFDITGRKCMEYKTQGETKISFTRQGLSAGGYVVRIGSSDGTFVIRKMFFL